MTILRSTLKACKVKPLNYFPLPSPNNVKQTLQYIEDPKQFNQILSQSIVSGLFNDPFISSTLLLHSLSNSPLNTTFSFSLFYQIPNPNLCSYNFMLKAYSQSSTPLESISLYNSMLRNSFFPDNYSFPFVFKACGSLSALNKGEEAHCLSLKLGFESDLFVQNALVSMYSACGVIEIARKVFDFIPGFIRDVVSWNSMISGYLKCQLNWDALKLFVEMLGSCWVRLDAVSLIGALSACGRMGLMSLGRIVHGVVLRNGFVLDVLLGSCLVDVYAKCGTMEDARKVFDIIPERSLVCWTSMAVGYVRSEMFREAVELFREMQLSGIVADAPLAACVISACGHAGALDQGRSVHSYCRRNGIEMNISVKNALIDMYSKCGIIEKALHIFNEMSTRDVFSWTAMISGLAMNGKSEESLDLFEQMEMSAGVMPNEVTFLGVLSACSHGGFVEKGFRYFRAMSQTYHVNPHIKHYGCMVDLLGRANLLMEAEAFINAMPIEPDVVIWRSLLFASQSHGNVELAEIVINKIEELEPTKSDARVLLSNAYASALRWGDVKRLRKGMARHKIQKQPGCSFIEVNGTVYEFLAEGGFPAERDEVYTINMRTHLVLRSQVPEWDV